MKKGLYNWRHRKFKVAVDYYDEEHEELLTAAPYPETIAEIVANSPVEIDTSEFLAYYLFRLLDRESKGIKNYRDALEEVAAAKALIRSFLFIHNGTLTADPKSNPVTEVREALGVSIGLSVISRIHGLTHADWSRIPETGGKGAKPTFDFRIASTGFKFIEVETKGSIVDDNSKKSPTISAHKRDILDKKSKLGNSKSKKKGNALKHLRYGTISVADKTGLNLVRCWILDPEPEYLNTDPQKYQLLARLSFASRCMELISPYSKVGSVLTERIEDIRSQSNWRELNQQQLLNSAATDDRFLPKGYFRNKSRTISGDVGGISFVLPDKTLAFVGLHHRLVELVIAQDFKSILNYSLEPNVSQQKVRMVFPDSKRETFLSRVRNMKRAGSHWELEKSITLYTASSGLVFGFELDE